MRNKSIRNVTFVYNLDGLFEVAQIHARFVRNSSSLFPIFQSGEICQMHATH